MNKKQIVPNYVGAQSNPTYPPTKAYAKAIILVYKPWISTFEDHSDRDYITEFNQFLTTAACLSPVKISYERAKQRYTSKTQFC